MHPSGLTLARWAWPFKTDAERVLVARWCAKQAKIELLNSEAARW
jgi:hypothetical protein